MLAIVSNGRNWILVLVGGFVLLTVACAPLTDMTIRQQQKYSTELTVNESYQVVFARVANQLRQCHFHAPMAAQLTVSADKDNHLKQATVRLTRLYGPVSEQVSFLVDVKEMEAGKSKVNIYSTGTYKKMAKASAAWATNESPSCTLES